jgi:Protein of unknown function (DUF3015)
MPAVGYAEPDTRAFILQHRPALEREIAVGSGESLYELSIVAGCQNLDAVQRELHEHREQIFASNRTDDNRAADGILSVLTTHPELRCVDLELDHDRVFAAGRRSISGVPEPGTAPRMR